VSTVLKLPDNIIAFQIPKRKPRIKEKEEIPFRKLYCVTPFRAATDKRLHEGTLRVLMLLCSYTNRAGITWVGQTTLGKHLGITKQAVSKQIRLLENLGYLSVVSKGFKGERADTRRVIFDETVSTEDAISIVSAQEDARPPYLVKQEEREMDEARRKALVEQATRLSKDFGKINVMKVDTTPRETDSITVREMRAKMKEHQEKVKRVVKTKREKLSKDADELMEKVTQLTEKSVVNPVDNSSHSQLHSQPDSQLLEVDQEVKDKVSKGIYIKVYKELINNIFKIERIVNEQDELIMNELIKNGLTLEMWKDVLTDILQTMKVKRQDPPQRIGWFRDGLMKVLNSPTA